MQQIDPAVIEEARWLDGPLSERDVADLAARKNLPPYVDRPEPVPVAFPLRRCGYDAPALRTFRLVAQRQAEDLERQAQDKWGEVARLDAKIADAERGAA